MYPVWFDPTSQKALPRRPPQSLSLDPNATAAIGPPWWILATVALGQLMVILDPTVVAIALPSAQKDIAFSNDDRQWIITAYSLAFDSLLLFGGKRLRR